jgi:hypothetical protein
MIRGLIGVSAAITAISLLTGFAAGAITAGIALAYFVSLVVHPNRQCASCQGSKRHGAAGSKNSRNCWTCKGKGAYPRLGVRLFRRDVVRGLAAGKHGRNW